jgi:putative glutamine amidotransferase
MDKPIILISVGKQNHAAVWNEVQTSTTGCDVQYVESVLRAGGVPVLLPRMNDVDAIRAAASMAHAVIFTGGGDIVSLSYGEEPHRAAKWPDLTRDEMELTLVRVAAELQLPVLGICRGMQLLNVAAGGTLIQDIPSEYPEAHQHSSDALEPIAAHTVEIEPESLLASVLGSARIHVNSTHHQAVKEVGVGLRVTARSRDGLVEGIEADNGRVLAGVQWHPEELSATDGPSRALFNWIVDEARRYQEQKASGRLPNAAGVVRLSSEDRELDLSNVDEHAPIPRISHAIIREALREQATEIHLDPMSKGIVVSYAIDNTLHEKITAPKHIQSELFANFRQLAGLDPGDRSTPQDGTIPLKFDGAEYRLNLKYHPSPVGESIFIKIDPAE